VNASRDRSASVIARSCAPLRLPHDASAPSFLATRRVDIHEVSSARLVRVDREDAEIAIDSFPERYAGRRAFRVHRGRSQQVDIGAHGWALTSRYGEIVPFQPPLTAYQLATDAPATSPGLVSAA
jgi:hypothetical protein